MILSLLYGCAPPIETAQPSVESLYGYRRRNPMGVKKDQQVV